MKRGAIAIIKNNGKVLLLSKKEGFQTLWQFPTCEIQENEEPEIAVLKKLKENFNIDANLRDFLDLLILPKSTLYFYNCSTSSEEIDLPKEFKNYLWLEKRELEQYLPKHAFEVLPTEVIKILKF